MIKERGRKTRKDREGKEVERLTLSKYLDISPMLRLLMTGMLGNPSTPTDRQHPFTIDPGTSYGSRGGRVRGEKGGRAGQKGGREEVKSKKARW